MQAFTSGRASPPAIPASCSFPGKDLRALVVEVPNLAIGLIESLTFKGKCYSALAQMLGTRSITERLAHLLLHLADLYGVQEADGILIGAAFTHADLAHMVGATRQWVTISLKRLQEKDVVMHQQVAHRRAAARRAARDARRGRTSEFNAAYRSARRHKIAQRMGRQSFGATNRP